MIDSDFQIPQLSLSDFEAGELRRAMFLRELQTAAHKVGFFYLGGHGIDVALLDELLELTRRFFALPAAEKIAIEMVHSPHFRGYTHVASELTRQRRDWREQIDIGAERHALPAETGSRAWTRLQGPNQWPRSLPSLRPVVLRWQAAAIAVLGRLMGAFALALGQQENALDPIFRDEPHLLVKLIRYPGRDLTEDDQGVGAHKDAGLLTLLLQDEQGGLQVETKRGWIDVTPRTGTLVVNIGELLELASNGYLRATLHRVVSPPASAQRFSAALFLGARLDATVPALPLPRELAAQARGPERDPSNPLYREVGLNQLKSRLRSHPDVARLHYADLLAEDPS